MLWLIWTRDGYLCGDGRTMLAAEASYWDDLESAKWQATRHGGQLVGYRPELDCTR
jgi:hypothetical protein